MPEVASADAHPLDAMLAVSDVIANRRFAKVYARVLELGSPTVAELAERLEHSTSTVYDDVDHLRELGVLERTTDAQPHRYRARPIEVTVHSGNEAYEVSSTLLVALARTEASENLRLFLDRHGTSGLATAVEYAREYVRGRTNARLLARDEAIPVLEAETVLQELRDVVLDVEPDLEADDLDVEELDDLVDESFEE